MEQLKELLSYYLNEGLDCEIDWKFTKYSPIKAWNLSGVSININNEHLFEFETGKGLEFRRIEDIKPLMRPLSSLTKEELEELGELIHEHTPNYPYYFTNGEYVIKELFRTLEVDELPLWIIKYLINKRIH